MNDDLEDDPAMLDYDEPPAEDQAKWEAWLRDNGYQSEAEFDAEFDELQAELAAVEADIDASAASHARTREMMVQYGRRLVELEMQAEEAKTALTAARDEYAAAVAAGNTPLADKLFAERMRLQQQIQEHTI